MAQVFLCIQLEYYKELQEGLQPGNLADPAYSSLTWHSNNGTHTLAYSMSNCRPVNRHACASGTRACEGEGGVSVPHEWAASPLQTNAQPQVRESGYLGGKVVQGLPDC
eukprot:scaffold114501_cov17-Tisochrysis_lutea.AAC.1